MTEERLIPSKKLLQWLVHNLRMLNPGHQFWLEFNNSSDDESFPFLSICIMTYEYNFDDLKCPKHFSYNPEQHLFFVDGMELIYLYRLKDNN